MNLTLYRVSTAP